MPIIEHKPQGDPCAKCGAPATRHKERKRERGPYWKERAAKTRKAAGKTPREPKEKPPRLILGLDGEGYTDKATGRHLYTYMAACDEHGHCHGEIYNPQGLGTHEIFTWLLTLPPGALLAGFSLGYDRTKWIEGMPDGAIYSIEHPDERQGAHGPLPVQWGRWRVNLVATRLTISRNIDGEKESRTVWDFFKFFQCSFVNALRQWTIASPGQQWYKRDDGVKTTKEIDKIEEMKAQRGNFEGIDDKEKAYCKSECALLAMLVRELLDAHVSEGIELRSYFGPGSTASVVLARAGAKEQTAPVPDEMALAVSSAYFGGRFEDSHVGPVRGKLYGYDIASAYPYALARLPCFAHGRFELVRFRSIDHANQIVFDLEPACISYRIEGHKDACTAWGPLPFRTETGEILYPVECGGGWAWNVELRAALKLHPGIVPLEAWVWRGECDCGPPFQDEISNLFNRRLEMGKTARGITVKLALNSMYGKSAQHIGAAVYRCMVRAGLITATTRAMLLELVARARDPWNVLELATDSVLSREDLSAVLPIPHALGTEEMAASKGKVPLGGWEPKTWSKGAFLLRPGMRFSLDRDKDKARTAARGLGVRVMHQNRIRILKAWRDAPMMPLEVRQPALFHGSKSSIRKVLGPFNPDGSQDWAYVRDDLYGRWQDPTPRRLSYAPGPKRAGIMASPVIPGAVALLPWRLPLSLRSTPYQATAEDIAHILAAEQPEFGGEAWI